MKATFKKWARVTLVLACVLACTATAYAYNTKFSFDLSSGWLSGWAYSSYATKFSVAENPVVKCTYASGSTTTFQYTVRNSNDEDRVVPFTATGTFGTRAFDRNTTVQNYKYKLGVKRDGGAWNSTATSQGQWNIDSY